MHLIQLSCKKTIVSWLDQQAEIAGTKKCNNLIISAEMFCALPEDLFRLFLSFLPQESYAYQFVIFSRDPYEWFFSSWLQGIKRDGVGQWLDNCLIGENIETNLGPLAKGTVIKSSKFYDDLYVIEYDKCKANIVEAFLNVIGIDENKQILLKFDTVRVTTNLYYFIR